MISGAKLLLNKLLSCFCKPLLLTLTYLVNFYLLDNFAASGDFIFYTKFYLLAAAVDPQAKAAVKQSSDPEKRLE